MERELLTYTSEPVASALEVTGPVSVVIHGMSTAKDTDWVARLSDVSPDGYSRPFAEGILRARYRDSKQHPELMEPNREYRFEVDLAHTSNVFLRGHRIRVVITSSCFPRWDRNWNTGGVNAEEVEGIVAVNTVFRDSARPSHIVLPVRGAPCPSGSST